MKNIKTVVEKTTIHSPNHKTVETFTNIQKDLLSPWERLKGKPGEFRYGEPESLLECLQRYPDRQLVACAAFLGGDDTPQIGSYRDLESDIAKRSLFHRKARCIILQCRDGAMNCAILVFFAKPCLPLFTDCPFIEIRWTSQDDSAACLDLLNFLGKCLIDRELGIAGGEA